ncbi:hypothetical protein PR048_025016 [Dryococelus australis]|uniref:Uncharacterized protein n=1 Tax=Dryococelus australis TaxID=614101 RepID=A0ABQ9GQ65_9NEOP|nr:hypothetical protein PR048_025016 [Dryococelus australis]
MAARALWHTYRNTVLTKDDYLLALPQCGIFTGPVPTVVVADSSPSRTVLFTMARQFSDLYRKWELCRTMTLVGRFSRGSPISPALEFRHCSRRTSQQGELGLIPDRFTPDFHKWESCRTAVPPSKANWVQYPTGSLRIFTSGNRAGRCRWSAGFFGDLPFPPLSRSGIAPYSPRLTLIGRANQVTGSTHSVIREELNILLALLPSIEYRDVAPPPPRPMNLSLLCCRSLTGGGKVAKPARAQLLRGAEQFYVPLTVKNDSRAFIRGLFAANCVRTSSPDAPDRLASHQGEPGSIPDRLTPDLRKRESCRTIPLVSGLSRGFSVSPALSFRHCSILMLRAAQISSLIHKCGGGRGGVMVRLNASHQGDPGSIPGGVEPRVFACGNRAGRCRRSAGFSRGSFVSPTLAFRHRSILPSLHPHQPPKHLHSSFHQCGQSSGSSLRVRQLCLHESEEYAEVELQLAFRKVVINHEWIVVWKGRASQKFLHLASLSLGTALPESRQRMLWPWSSGGIAIAARCSPVLARCLVEDRSAGPVCLQQTRQLEQRIFRSTEVLILH